MKTKFHIIIGADSHEVPSTDIRNWDEVEFTLERKDYSGVMRSFSSEFKFVGETFTMLRDLYLTDGFLASAWVAVSTKNNDWTYSEQFRCPLDFSTVEIENGTMTINAIDNTLAGLLKSKKGQKYEFAASDLDLTNIEVKRIEFANEAKFTLPVTANTAGTVDVRKNESASTVISTEYVEPADESTGYDGVAINRFFAKINRAPSPNIRVSFEGFVRCSLSTHRDPSDLADLNVGYWVDDSNPHFQLWDKLCDNDITKELRYGSWRNKWIGKSTHANYASLDALKAAAASGTDILGLYPGYFGIVGNNPYPYEAYWTDNTVYEYNGSQWVSKGAPDNYYKDKRVTASTTFGPLTTNDYPRLELTNNMRISSGKLTMTWTDSARSSVTVGGILPIDLLQHIVESISDGASASIAEDSAGLLAKTYIIPAESLRNIGGAKVYSTFQQFADWMGSVFGYTYRVVGNEVQFLHRSEVFSADNVKVIDEVRGVKYSINNSLIYSEVDAGYSKKEYGEVNGRLEANFTNYYATGYSSTDKKLSLISKYRADGFGIEVTLRKGEKEKETTDDKSDEDVFFACADDESGTLTYRSSKNEAYAPAVCVANNSGFIAALGNGKAVTLTMTSSDGNNALANIAIAAGTALFTAGKLEFTTDDMTIPEDWDGLVSIDHDGYRFRGFISKASARYGRQNGMEYELIIKDITEL